MPIVKLFCITAAVFLTLDALMLKFVMKPLFLRHLGSLMADSPRFGPVVAFYLAYVAAVLYLVSLPALRAAAPQQALLSGAVLGFAAYGTYEFTSYAILRDWHVSMLAADVLWGSALTAFSAWAGVVIVRAI